MKTLAERVKLARKTLKKQTGGLYTQTYVAKAVGLEQQSYADIETGKSKRPRNIEKLAEVLQTTPAWLQFGIGASPAYLPTDVIPADHMPVLPMGLVKDWLKNRDLIPLVLKAEIKFIGNPLRGNGSEFAIRLDNDAMTSPVPEKISFRKGSVVIVDLEKTPAEGDFVIALQDGNQTIFSQYISYAGQALLKPLNPQYPTITVNENIKIYGVAVVSLDFLKL